MSAKENYEACGRRLFEATRTLPESNEVHRQVVKSSFFEALLADDPADVEWQHKVLGLTTYGVPALYQSRYTFLANLVGSIVSKEKDGSTLERLVQEVISADRSFRREESRKILAEQIGRQNETTSDGEAHHAAERFLEEQDLQYQAFLKNREDSPEKFYEVVDRVRRELHEQMRKDGLVGS